MFLALLLAIGLAWWLHKRGELLPNLLHWGGTAAIGLIGLRMLETGKPLLALAAAAVAYGWWRTQAPKPKLPMDKATNEAAARALLRVPPGASADAIQSAWRSAMQTAHPDAGGSNQAAAALTAARDLLLSRDSR